MWPGKLRQIFTVYPKKILAKFSRPQIKTPEVMTFLLITRCRVVSNLKLRPIFFAPNHILSSNQCYLLSLVSWHFSCIADPLVQASYQVHSTQRIQILPHHHISHQHCFLQAWIFEVLVQLFCSSEHSTAFPISIDFI